MTRKINCTHYQGDGILHGWILCDTKAPMGTISSSACIDCDRFIELYPMTDPELRTKPPEAI